MSRSGLIAILAVSLVLFIGWTAEAQQGWQPVVGAGAATPAGFGNSENRGATASAILGGALYVGTLNDTVGAEAWRSFNGTNWTRINSDGFGGVDPSYNTVTYSMAEFNGDVYAATWATGAPSTPASDTKVWRYESGTSWTQVNAGGFGDGANSEPWAMVEFNGYLYISAANYPGGAEIWRSSNGTSWTIASDAGFGNGNNVDIGSMAVHNGYLFAATVNFVDGVEVWRSANGTSWNPVATSADFGGPDDLAAYAMVSFGAQLYVSTFNQVSGGTIYRTPDGTTWSLLVPTAGGFGDANNWGAHAAVDYNGGLYLSTFNWATGTELWYSPNGGAWIRINDDGFGDDHNYAVMTFSKFNGLLYAGLRNDNGCQIWWYSSLVFVDGFESSDTSEWSTTVQ